MDAYTLTLYDDAGNPIPIPAIQGIGIKGIRLKEAGEVEDTYEIVLDDERVYSFVVKHGKTGPKGDPGETGAPGQPGKDGSDGKDGTSVTVTNVSHSSDDGGSNVVTFSDGKTLTVKNGSKGSSGSNGKDGTSVTHSWSGTTLTVTSASGTSSANLKGDKGDTYTLTAADKTAIAQEAAGMVDVPEIDTSKVVMKSGATMEGVLKAQNNSQHTVPQVRNAIYLPEGSDMPTTAVGEQCWFYEVVD